MAHQQTRQQQQDLMGVLRSNEPFGRAASDDFEAGSGMRVGLDHLLKSRRAQIDELASVTQTERAADPKQFDDIFLLRFVLTWEKRGGMPKAIDAVKQTVAWRLKNAKLLDEVCRPGGKTPNEDKILNFETVGFAGDLDGLEPLYCVRTGHCDIKSLMQSFSIEEITEWLHLTKERSYRICDERTRSTGKLIKLITVIDMDNFSLFGGDKRFYKALGESSKMAAVFYPQLLGKTVMINTPSYFRTLYSGFSLFMPQSFLDKMSVCPATGTCLANCPDAKTCPFLQKYLGNKWDSLCSFLGGTQKTPENLIPREQLDNRLTKIVLANRSSTTVEFDVPGAGFTAKWEVIVKDFGVGMKAILVPEDGSPSIEVIPEMKVKSDGGLTEGYVELPQKGRLEVTFDNSYSMFRGKTFEYRLTVMEVEATKPAVTAAAVDVVAEQVRKVVHM